MNSGPSGFHNAPVTKFLVVVCGLVSVLVGLQGGARACSISYQEIFRKLQLWRLVSAPLVFSSTPETVFGLYLVYFFRVFERHIGSNKYTVFLLFCTTLTTILELVALAAIQDPTALGGFLSPGPYGLIFASFVPFSFDIPISTRFRVFGVRFSDKSFIYAAGLQLLLSSWKRSLIPGLCGFLAGLTYRSNILGLRRLKFPDTLASATSRLLSPLFSPAPTTATSTGRAQGSRDSASAHLARPFEGRFTPTAPPLAAAMPPQDESVATLISMGFDRNSALQALSRSRNDINAATNLLLESQAH
eukprot:TRINITY_DN24713_c0_g1_i1.p1 TRINITY_DN24713_c0_g1~~TRINITY_DN24713_c0_g1_i1.p1  ORF type:complete len:303 (-),score=32.66 TRINITY_DN24713_c0_g1_i1:169-1077(-)